MKAHSDVEISVTADGIQLGLKRKGIPEINETLVKAGISVYGINNEKRTLEEKFLEITKVGETL